MLKARVLTAIVLLVGFLAALFLLPAPLWLALSALVGVLAAWEWGGLCALQRAARAAFAALAGALVLLLGLGNGLHLDEVADTGLLRSVYGISALFWVLVVPFWLRAHWRLKAPLSWLTGLVVVVPAALALAHLRQLSPLVLLAAMSLVWVADIAAFFSGRRFGRHKLAPSVSPGKTWEGAWGAALAVVLLGVAWLQLGDRLAGPLSWVLAVLLLIVLTSVSIIGDLFESLMKRQAGVKDSGKLLPGHGGVLDRIDSLTSTLPLVLLLLLVAGR